jgi:hypothetical protein
MVVANNKINETKNAGKLTMISMAMAMVIQRYDAGRTARWSTSRASQSHWMPPSGKLVQYCPGGRQNTNKTQFLASNYGTFRALVVCENFNPKKDPLLSSSMQQASCKCEMPRLEL